MSRRRTITTTTLRSIPTPTIPYRRMLITTTTTIILILRRRRGGWGNNLPLPGRRRTGTVVGNTRTVISTSLLPDYRKPKCRRRQRGPWNRED